ncbi:alpha/beta fold hydrolase [Rhodovibrio salinarum]|uniref:Alpha/beta hydrolase n=1 Tax=Rhodovibrio salinarum TaxID=1087 RepID=A0A934V0C2_9PROT|nr:alpha/beta fold hydrolase [Rhodovibrio salinarum]MBK1697274.1 alpha/beta hydrolase [Rhodovibrio salinarum]
MTQTLNTLVTGDGPPLVVLHGLFGQAKNWATIAKGLADGRRVIAADLRNHGASPWSDEMTYPAMADDVAGLIEQLPEGRAEVLGHSMGGKAAMVLALTRPELVDRLIVADIAPMAYSGGSLLPFVDAMLAVDPARHDSRKSVEQELKRAVQDPGIRQFLLSNLTRGDSGFRWTLNLSTLRAAMDTLAGWPDVDGRYDGATLFLAGARSDYVTEAARPAIDRHFPNAQITRVPAGHWVHAEAPQATLTALRAFLELE